MPRSFLVKRRKSGDVKSVIEADGTNEVLIQNSDCSGETVQSEGQDLYRDHYQSVFPSAVLEKNHRWSLSNSPYFAWHPAHVFPPLCNACVKFTAAETCVGTHCSFQRKLDECNRCRNCLPSRKLISNCAHFQVPPWYNGANYGAKCHGDIFPYQHDTFFTKPVFSPFARCDFDQGGETRAVGRASIGLHNNLGDSQYRINANVDHNLKVIRKEDQSAVGNGNISELDKKPPTKKMKLADSSESDSETSESENKTTTSLSINSPNTTNETNPNLPALSENDYGDILSKQLLKKEMKDTCTVQENFWSDDSESKEETQCEESNVTERDSEDPTKTETTHKVLMRRKHSTKSKKGIKNGNMKPYNTRIVTSRSRTYSSDFVIPGEEDWKHEKEAYQNTSRGRHRSKLNRLLANEHERRRVAQLNSAYQDLRQLIPGYQCDTKLPKIKILKYAINYIAHLGDLLGE